MTAPMRRREPTKPSVRPSVTALSDAAAFAPDDSRRGPLGEGMSPVSAPSRIFDVLPRTLQRRLDACGDALSIFSEIRDPRVARSLGPSGVRGFVLQRGKQGVPTKFQATHRAHLDWSYPSDMPEMHALYERAKLNQWNGSDLPWQTSVDPFSRDVPLLPPRFVDFDGLRRRGICLTPDEEQRFTYSMVAWMLSQFLHGEQGALLAAAQVTEAVQFFDGKLYGSTQVVDEGRHVEVFHRYLEQKLERIYPINDNLFTIIDALLTDARWDMKFLGMQIMVEGLALGAFGTLFRLTKEPLLKMLLRRVIQDEARHVHYGVLALRAHISTELSERERAEREDWAFEVALLMRDRFLALEVYEEWFEGRLSRDEWKRFVNEVPGMQVFRQVMFTRLVPNLREIGLLSPRILPHYERAGLARYFHGRAADALTIEDLLAEQDDAA